MAKTISADLFHFYSAFFPNLAKRTDVFDLWNMIFDNGIIEDGYIEIGKTAKMSYTIKGKEYEYSCPRREIIEEDGVETRAEHYELLVSNVLKQIIERRLIKKPRAKRK